MRKPFVAGNWKMNLNKLDSVELIKGLSQGLNDIDTEKVDIAVYPPFVYIDSVVNTAKSSPIAVGAQDFYFESNGAFTGEISTDMLKDVGCIHALCGHSERRHVLGESDELINKKVTAAILGGLLPTLCVGELLEERQAEKTEDIVINQVKKGLEGLAKEKVSAVTLAYEPVWAIGTGLTATPQQAQDVHAMIRKLIAELYDQQTADQMRIQYGGSVKPNNAEELFGKPDIDGFLVGGASLKAEDFKAIIAAVIK